MNLEKLFKAQQVLRDKINYNEPDRFEKLVLALLVEIGELCQEWRGFKFWSKNQEPAKPYYTTGGATKENAVGFSCGECGDFTKKGHPWFELIMKDHDYKCQHCGVPEMYMMREKNPLLEEYVDGLHFVLEIGLEVGIENHIPRELISFHQRVRAEDFKGIYWLVSGLKLDMLLLDKDKREYEVLMNNYLLLGKKLGFTWEQIEQAYFAKNEVNHQRQENGY